jgi:sugar/nucleoside kinase (ribokinase family)
MKEAELLAHVREVIGLIRSGQRDPALLESMRAIERRHLGYAVFHPGGTHLTRQGKRLWKALGREAKEAEALALLMNAAEAVPTEYILVIGSAHLDILADFQPDQIGLIDKIGLFHYCAGGTAFNIAINLAHCGKPVVLYTHLRRGSLAADLISRRCRSNGIPETFIVEEDHFPDSAFIAHRCKQDLISAVSAMAISEAKLSEDRLREALRHCRLAATECNLIESQLALVSRLAYEEKKPLLMAGVSAPKAPRVQQVFQPANGERALLLFALNQHEAEHFMGGAFGTWTGEALLAKAQARNAVVSRGPAGCVLYAAGRPALELPAPVVPTICSTSGAGDALFSAFCDSYFETGGFVPGDLKGRIDQYVGAVLGSEGSTLGAIATEHELHIKTYTREEEEYDLVLKRAVDEERRKRRFFQRLSRKVIWAFGLLTTVVFFFGEDFRHFREWLWITLGGLLKR